MLAPASEGSEMGPVQKLLHNTVGVPVRGVKRLARTATQPLKARRQARATRRRSRSSSRHSNEPDATDEHARRRVASRSAPAPPKTDLPPPPNAQPLDPFTVSSATETTARRLLRHGERKRARLLGAYGGVGHHHWVPTTSLRNPTPSVSRRSGVVVGTRLWFAAAAGCLQKSANSGLAGGEPLNGECWCKEPV